MVKPFKARLYSFGEICMEVSLQNKSVYCNMSLRHVNMQGNMMINDKHQLVLKENFELGHITNYWQSISSP